MWGRRFGLPTPSAQSPAARTVRSAGVEARQRESGAGVRASWLESAGGPLERLGLPRNASFQLAVPASEPAFRTSGNAGADAGTGRLEGGATGDLRARARLDLRGSQSRGVFQADIFQADEVQRSPPFSILCSPGPRRPRANPPASSASRRRQHRTPCPDRPSVPSPPEVGQAVSPANSVRSKPGSEDGQIRGRRSPPKGMRGAPWLESAGVPVGTAPGCPVTQASSLPCRLPSPMSLSFPERENWRKFCCGLYQGTT